MAWLPHGEKISKISLFVLAQLTNVTDGQTDRWTLHADIYRAYAYALCGKDRHFYVPRPSFFCLLWVRPCGNHAKCCINEKTIRCLPNPSQNVSTVIWLSSTVSQLFEPQVQKLAVFMYRSPHFCFPWRRPCDYHPICCMDRKKIQCLPNPSQLVPISIFNSFRVIRCLSQCVTPKIAIFTTFWFPLGTPLGQSR